MDNGIYWFKISLEPSDKNSIISIPESHISRAYLYTTKDDEIFKNTVLARYVSFEVPASNKAETYYLKVNCLLEARIPIEIKTVK